MTKVLVLLLALVSIPAQAEAIMWCLNTDGGKIVLTDEKCKNKVGHLAYTLNNTSETTLGCWTNDSLAIHVLWSDKYLRSYDYKGWTIVEKNNTSTM